MDNIKCAFGAIFKCKIYKSDGTLKEESGEFHNLVLDSGLARMGKGTWINRCMVGTGNSEPTVGQTKLDSFRGSSTTVIGLSDTTNKSIKPYYLGVARTYRFNTGTVVGNLTEVGLGWSDTNCWNRTLIKDAQGNPTVLTILEDEYLDVTAEVRMYPSMELSGNFNFRNKLGEVLDTYNYVGWPRIDKSGDDYNQPRIISFTMYSGNATDNPSTTPSGSPIGSWVNSDVGVSSGDYSTDFTVVIPLAWAGNVNSFEFHVAGFLRSSYSNGFKINLSKPLPKTGTQEFTFKLRVSWGRYTGG